MNGYKVERATSCDVAAMLEIFGRARAFMAGQGNPQWADGYPYPEDIEERVERGCMFKLACGGDIAAVFSALDGDEDYKNCKDIWLTAEGEYLAVHTVAVNDAYRGKGCARAIFAAAEDMARVLSKRSLRIDTHEKNAPMRSLLQSLGFCPRGEITLYGGKPRLAYEKLL